MNLTLIDAALWALSLGGELVVLGVLVRRRLYRPFPIFFGYILFCVVSDVSFIVLFPHLSQKAYMRAYFTMNNVPELLLEIGILIEVARSVLDPVKRSLPRPALYVFAGMLAVGTFAALLLSRHSQPAELDRWSQYFVHVNLAVAILRVAIFSVIASFSQMLGIGWKNHVLQIATGFLGFSIVALLIEVLHHIVGVTNASAYHLLDQFRVVGWCVALGYWSVALAKKEAPRREFSPKMASFLISIATGSQNDRPIPARWYRK